MRAIIFGLIVCLVAFNAVAQEEHNDMPRPGRPGMARLPGPTVPVDVTSLSVLGATPPGKNDLTHQIVFPRNMTRDEAIDACVDEMREFLKHNFPEQVELRARAATCFVPEVVGEPS